MTSITPALAATDYASSVNYISSPTSFSHRSSPRPGINQISGKIIGACIKVHRRLGPGLLESAYEACVAYELRELGLQLERQKAVPLIYENVKLDCGFRADMLVEGTVVVEFKSKEAVHPVDYAQLLSHLRLVKIPIGLLINFHVTILKNGITRMVNDYREEPDGKVG
ncbi:MAG: GxxExxY protein [Candidatus Sulfotelmatobacter sp.]